MATRTELIPLEKWLEASFYPAGPDGVMGAEGTSNPNAPFDNAFNQWLYANGQSLSGPNYGAQRLAYARQRYGLDNLGLLKMMPSFNPLYGPEDLLDKSTGMMRREYTSYDDPLIEKLIMGGLAAGVGGLAFSGIGNAAAAAPSGASGFTPDFSGAIAGEAAAPAFKGNLFTQSAGGLADAAGNLYAPSAASLGGGAAVPAAGTDWWTQYGLTPGDVGMTPGTTSPNFPMSELTGGVLTDAGSAAPWAQELSKVPTSLLQKAQEALKAGGTASTIASSLGLSEGAVSLLGKLGATALGVLGSNQQAKSLQELATKYQEYGAPSRARFEASMTPGFDPMSIPGYGGAVDTASKGLLARLSATGGNPYGNPGGMIEANKSIISGTAMPAINEYQRLNANTGFGGSMNAALGLQTQGIGADANSLNAIGYGLNAVTNPQPSLMDLYKQFGKGSLA